MKIVNVRNLALFIVNLSNFTKIYEVKLRKFRKILVKLTLFMIFILKNSTVTIINSSLNKKTGKKRVKNIKTIFF